MRLVIGVGARPGVSVAELDGLVDAAVEDPSAVAAVSTVDARRAEVEPLARRRGWPLLTFPAQELARVTVPNPSALVAAAIGTPSVAEAAALRAAGAPAVLLVNKRTGPGSTVAVAAAAPPVTVVGVGADGWDGLGVRARAAISAADVLLGSGRQLALVPPNATGADRVAWPTPLLDALPGLLARHPDRRVSVLASGDPMYYGIGSTLVRLLGAAHVDVLPQPSAVSLACARLGWAVEEVDVLSAVGRPVDAIRRVLHPGRLLLVLSADATTPASVVALLADAGYGASEVTVLENLGGRQERVHHDPSAAGPLNIVAVRCVGSSAVAVVPGLRDTEYQSDGQLTKREVRAVTLAALAPAPGELLWDVGAGSGSIAIEWLRAHPACRAVAVESDADRAARIAHNAARLGVPGLPIVLGEAPGALDTLERPDAVFIGGGVTVPGVVERCWAALRPGGRLVVNAVTVESERVVTDWHAKAGGELTRIAVNRAAPIGGFTAWRPMLPVTQWAVCR